MARARRGEGVVSVGWKADKWVLASLQDALRFDAMLRRIVNRWQRLVRLKSGLDACAMQRAVDRAFVGDFQQALFLIVANRSGQPDFTDEKIGR